MKKIFLSSALVLLLSSCMPFQMDRTKEIDHLNSGAKMNVKTFFDGDLTASGIRQDSHGKIIGTYSAKINGKWDENKGVVKYSFTMSDKKDSRTWLLTLNDDQTIEGVGHDIAKAVQGNQIGNAMRMFYSLSVKKDGKKEEVSYEDKIYLVDEKSAILISKSKKRFGETETIISSINKQ